jgi:glycosyltransferase involved in cell wall biosynthesis
MRILELNFEKSWRGGERQTLYNMQGFRNAGISTELVCRKNAALEARATADGFTVHSFGSVAGVVFFLLRHAKKYDCIHAQTSHILTYCMLTRWAHRRKIIFTRRVNFTPKGFFTKLKYNAADAIVAISHEVKKTVENFCGRKDVTMISDIVVPQTPDEKTAANILRDYTSTGKKIIGTTAAFTSEKDPVTMVGSIKKLYALRQDFVFLHFGDGPMLQGIQTMINEYGLQDVYRLMGFSPHVADVLPFFKVFVLTSIEEGLGSSVLDAFINQVPVVSTNAGGLKELLQHERGIACATGDSDAIANGIHTFLHNSDKRETCVQHAWQYVQQYHSMDYITQQYIHLINQ